MSVARLESGVGRHVDLLEGDLYRAVLEGEYDDRLHFVAKMATGPRVDSEMPGPHPFTRRHTRHSSASRSAAARGSTAAMIGRPTTM